jgi:hypothetical protein
MKYYFAWFISICIICFGGVIISGAILPKNIDFEKNPIFAFYQIFGVIVIFLGLIIGFSIPHKKSLK